MMRGPSPAMPRIALASRLLASPLAARVAAQQTSRFTM
jgi:hypothetical protein